jgi:predicted metalloprotease with PDZ domain
VLFLGRSANLIRERRMVVRYLVDAADTVAHQFHVTLDLAAAAPTQRLSLPVWIPGSYLVREFARHVSGLQAWRGGRPVPVVQLDKCTWEVQDGHQDLAPLEPLRVRWSVYALDASVRTAWLDSERGFFNGTSLFLACEGLEDQPHQVQLTGLPQRWEIATAMRTAAEAAPATFVAANYDELIDHPFELGTFWRGHFEAGGRPHELVISGAWPLADHARLLAQTQQICATQIRFWHGEGEGASLPPFERYVFLLRLVHEGYGGLEHRASTALIASRADMPRCDEVGASIQGPGALSDGHLTLLGLISHEYFHTWNVKRIRPPEFAPYDLGRENYTELLWFFEGFTSYYDDLMLLRAGLIDVPRYLGLVSKTIRQVLDTPGRKVQSLAQSSFDAWVKYYRPDENTVNATVSYYTKGALVALALDLRLRGLLPASGASLDQVMQGLWQRSQSGPITEAMLLALVAEYAGAERSAGVCAELLSWVHGTEDLPLLELLQAVGVAWQEDTALLPQRLGLRLQETPSGIKVQAVLRGGAGEAAGLSAGDEWLALDGWRILKLLEAAQLGAAERALPLLVARDRRLLSLTLPATPKATTVSLKLLDESLLTAWLGVA